MRPQHEILEELVTGVRGISSRMRDFDPEYMDKRSRRFKGKYRFHPRMFDEMADFVSERDGDPITLLMISGMLREDLPWMSEILTETYRELKNTNFEQAEKISYRLRRLMKEMLHGPFGMEMMEGSESSYMMAIELAHIVDRIIERNMKSRVERKEIAIPSEER